MVGTAYAVGAEADTDGVADRDVGDGVAAQVDGEPSDGKECDPYAVGRMQVRRGNHQGGPGGDAAQLDDVAGPDRELGPQPRHRPGEDLGVVSVAVIGPLLSVQCVSLLGHHKPPRPITQGCVTYFS